MCIFCVCVCVKITATTECKRTRHPFPYTTLFRSNSVRSRNARLAAIRTFLKYASHHDLASLATIERALAIPLKRFDRSMVGFLSRPEISAILEAPDRLSWAGQRDRALFSMMYNTGDRKSTRLNSSH